MQLECDTPERSRFHGEILLDRLNKLSTSYVSGSAQNVRRRRRDIRRATQESFLVSIQLRRSGIVSQGGRIAQLCPGDLALYSSTNPYELTLPDDFQQLVVQIPRSELLQRLPNADLLTGMRVDGQSDIGTLVRDGVLGLTKSAVSANPTMQHCMESAMVDLLATGLATLDGADAQLASPARQILVRADSVIDAHLHNPGFDRNELARRLGLSLRRLAEICQADGSAPAQRIRNARLDRAGAYLRDARFSRESVTSLALRCGFTNMQSFSRMFAEHFGRSPREWRATGRKSLS